MVNFFSRVVYIKKPGVHPEQLDLSGKLINKAQLGEYIPFIMKILLNNELVLMM